MTGLGRWLLIFAGLMIVALLAKFIWWAIKLGKDDEDENSKISDEKGSDEKK